MTRVPISRGVFEGARYRKTRDRHSVGLPPCGPGRLLGLALFARMGACGEGLARLGATFASQGKRDVGIRAEADHAFLASAQKRKRHQPAPVGLASK